MCFSAKYCGFYHNKHGRRRCQKSYRASESLRPKTSEDNRKVPRMFLSVGKRKATRQSLRCFSFEFACPTITKSVIELQSQRHYCVYITYQRKIFKLHLLFLDERQGKDYRSAKLIACIRAEKKSRRLRWFRSRRLCAALAPLFF